MRNFNDILFIYTHSEFDVSNTLKNVPAHVYHGNCLTYQHLFKSLLPLVQSYFCLLMCHTFSIGGRLLWYAQCGITERRVTCDYIDKNCKSAVLLIPFQYVLRNLYAQLHTKEDWQITTSFYFYFTLTDTKWLHCFVLAFNKTQLATPGPCKQQIYFLLLRQVEKYNLERVRERLIKVKYCVWLKKKSVG